MMRLMKLLSIVGVGLLISGTAEAQQRYVLSLNWIPHALHYGIYVAKEKGWYKSAGIDLDIQRGYGSGDTVKRVATGAAAFGLADAASVIVGRAQGLYTKLVAMIMDRPADAVYFIKGSGIAKPKDLEGRRIGLRDHWHTAAVCIRGLLSDEYGVSFDGVDGRPYLRDPCGTPRRAPERLHF